ncbi:MAG: zinc-binding dehydrogenase [Phycisphaera sp.]|nr:zinc-binding dehydrogenase [Phycisphaera sp.]
MKQIIQSYRTGELWLADVPAPALKSAGVVVRTASSLVSAGTERMILELAKKSLIGKARARPDLVKQVLAKIKTDGFTQTMSKVFAKLDTPITLGYSCAGTVTEAPRDLADFTVGDRVACAGAGYATHAEYNYIPRNLCVKIPDGVGFDDASFTTVGSIAMQGVRQADLRLGECVAVIGLGLIGLLTVQMLKASGCRVIGFDLDPSKCALAKELGADAATNDDPLAAAENFSRGMGVDAAIITAATPSNGPIETAAEIARTKGRVVIVGLVGMDIPRDPFYKKELDLRLSMSYGPGRYDPTYEERGIDYPFAYVRWTEQRNMQSFLQLIAEGKVTPSKLITHHFDIDKALDAYNLLEGKPNAQGVTEKYLGIVIQYPQPTAADEKPVRRIEIKPLAGGNSVGTSGGKIGVGFIGAGNFAKSVLIPALVKSESARLVGVATATGISAEEVARKHGFAYASTDYQQLLNDKDVSAVFVATQHNSHAKFACEALAAGKHVFVEKPLCIRPEDIERYQQVLAEASSAGGSPCLMVGFNRRFSPHAAALRKAFAGRATPMVVSYRVNAGVIPRNVWVQDPEVGGGRIVGEVCHFVDFCESVIGSQPVRVYASSIQSDNAQVVPQDSIVITINYADGSLTTIQYLAHGSTLVSKEYVEVTADGVTAVLDNFRRTDFHGSKTPPVKGAQAKGFAEEIGAFLGATRGGDWPIDWQSILRTTRLTFAVGQSLRELRPIDLDPST